MEMGIYLLSGFLIILGIAFILFPLKAKEIISSKSNFDIRGLGFAATMAGLYITLLSFVFAYAFYIQPFILNIFNPSKVTMLNPFVFLLQHFCLCCYFFIGICLVIIGTIVLLSTKKIKQIIKESSNFRLRTIGSLFFGFGVISIIILHVLAYIGYLQKQPMR
jgi:uncharacterized protein YjeT (DUF2065 family)